MTGHKKLLWLFTSDADLPMITYMNGLPGISDAVMKDGTTAFFIALGRQKCDMVKELLQHKREEDVKLARYALLEPKIKPNLKDTIEGIIGTSTPEGSQNRKTCQE